MAMGRGIRVFHTPNESPYRVLIEQRGHNQALLLEAQAILTLGPTETENIKKDCVKLCDAFGVLGNLKLTSAEGVLHYLVLVTGCVSVGKLGSSEVYKITECKTYSLRGYGPDEEKVSEFRKLLNSGAAYFSWSGQGSAVDLTMSAQKIGKFPDKSDGRFFWNRTLHLPYLLAGVPSNLWLVRIMFGSVEIRTVYVGAKQAKAVLISRLSNERAGTRFEVRGVDDDGHVANFVETEQLITLDNASTSFVQIRGSVPLFWEQPGVNVGSHKIKIARGLEMSAPAFEKHFTQLAGHYGDVVIINLLGSSLVGSKEGEATLSTSYQSQHSRSAHKDIPHILWDFHAEGGAKNLERLDSQVSKTVERLSHYHWSDGSTVQVQTGVVRTNCTDCLDRTNAVQMMLGLKTMLSQLKSLQVELKDSTVSRFEDSFKQMWLTNGNALSKIYAGTAALSQGGSKFLDGARSARRTIQNNLLDKDKQEAFDLLVHGSGLGTDFHDRARLLMPEQYWTLPEPLLQSLSQQWIHFTRSEPLRVAVGTYNINGGKHFRSVVYKNVSLDDWLLDGLRNNENDLVSLGLNTKGDKPIDVYAIGFEEMVDLDAKNIVNASGENAREWAAELTKTLNRDMEYSLVTYQQLVGVCLYVFVRPELAPGIRDVLVDDVKTGMGGTTGNKGAVAISFTFAATSFCFLCSHFAAGQSQVAERNNDYNEAVKRISFANGRTVLNHDYVFWCGDFNYRINLPREQVKEAVSTQEYHELLAADQLKIEHSAGNVFEGFLEGDIQFAPTYKYDLFSDDYDTSEKCRVPAWTDRVLWRRRTPAGPLPADWSAGQVVWYGRAELKQSDHRPVLAVIDIQTRVVDVARRGQVIGEVLSSLDTLDGTVILTPVAAAGPPLVSQEMVEAVNGYMSQFGDVRYSRAVRGAVWTQFRCCTSAMKSLGTRYQALRIGGVEYQISAPSFNCAQMLTEDTSLVSNNGSHFTVDTNKKFSMDQTKSKKPPPRPAAPPGRPSAPPTRSAAAPKPARPAPARPGTDVTIPNVSLAPIEWPDEEVLTTNIRTMTVTQPPTVPRRNIGPQVDLSTGPPPSPPPPLPSYINCEPPSEPPPSLPSATLYNQPPLEPPPAPPASLLPPGPPRLPGRPGSGAAPPVPRR